MTAPRAASVESPTTDDRRTGVAVFAYPEQRHTAWTCANRGVAGLDDDGHDDLVLHERDSWAALPGGTIPGRV